jgi:small subunit ribosomal protein S14
MKKQQELIRRYADIRRHMKHNCDYEGLRKLPINVNPNRLKNRYLIDGRSRRYIQKFGLSRINFRILALQGKLPGIKKSSW